MNQPSATQMRDKIFISYRRSASRGPRDLRPGTGCLRSARGTIGWSYRYAVEEELLDHSRPHGTALSSAHGW